MALVPPTTLLETSDGLTFQHLHEEEAEFLCVGRGVFTAVSMLLTDSRARWRVLQVRGGVRSAKLPATRRGTACAG